MGSSKLKLYRPFLAVILAQALFIAVAPSLPSGDEVATQSPLPPGLVQSDVEGVFVDPETGELFTAEGAPVDAGGGPGGTVVGTGRTGSAAPRPGGGGPGAAQGSAADMSHCKGDRQFDI
ncbi:MAG: hypothetical protein KY395_05700, partial [Actinobacteria bacterium]|nr:hypothetical protein [Actinomycetota bacterium]